MKNMKICPNCQGPIAVRNPTGTCDHLQWPDYLTPEAKRKVLKLKWISDPADGVLRQAIYDPQC